MRCLEDAVLDVSLQPLGRGESRFHGGLRHYSLGFGRFDSSLRLCKLSYRKMFLTQSTYDGYGGVPLPSRAPLGLLPCDDALVTVP